MIDGLEATEAYRYGEAAHENDVTLVIPQYGEGR